MHDDDNNYDRDYDSRPNREHKDSDDWSNIRGSMADNRDDLRGKNAIESRIKEEENDEFVSLTEDKKQKKTFLNKILRSLEDDDKEEMKNKDNEVRTGVKKSGFASRIKDEEDNAEESLKVNQVKTNPLSKSTNFVQEKESVVDKTKKRGGFASRFADDDDNDFSSKIESKKEEIRSKPITTSGPASTTTQNTQKRGFASRITETETDNKIDNIKPSTSTQNTVKPDTNKPKPRGFASKFIDDEETDEIDKPRAFIGKLKTVTQEVKQDTVNNKEKLNFKSKNKIIEEDFSDDDNNDNDNQNIQQNSIIKESTFEPSNDQANSNKNSILSNNKKPTYEE